MSFISFLVLSVLCLPVAAFSRDAPPPAPGIKDFGIKEYVRVSRALPHVQDTPWKLVCTIPYNCHFQPIIEVEAPAGQTLLFNSTNPLVLYLTKTESATTAAGLQTLEAKNWISGEGAIYTIPAGVTVKSVRYRETGYDTTFAGSFQCNDEDYNILWKKGARTAYLCMRDHFYDCPDRERVGFWGDGTPELGQCFYAFDLKSHRLCKDLVLRPLQPKFYPGQHLEFLGSYGLWFYYLQTGDLASMRAIYEPTKTFLFETYQFGNPRTWYDWGDPIRDTAVIETCFYYDCLQTLRKIGGITGHEADFPAIDQKLESIRSTFHKTYWKNGSYMSDQVKTPDDRANAMAVNCGLAAPSTWNDIYQNVLSKKTFASNFFDRWVFEALCKMGREEHALLRMEQRYRTMIPARFTTLWEHYDRIWATRNSFDLASSLNHGWNPPVLNLSQTIAGVAPVEPGWSTFQVLPKEAFLTEIRVVVPTVKGDVTVGMKKDAATYTLDVSSPPGAAAIVGIPKGSFTRLDSVEADGQTVWKGSFQLGVSKDIHWIGDDSGYLKFSVPPGTHKLIARGGLPTASPKKPAKPVVRETPLDSRTWVATASVPDGTYPFTGRNIPIETSAAHMIDGDPWTGWRDMTDTLRPGQWVQVDMQKPQTFNKITLDNTWALWDSPVACAVSVSNDGQTWSEPVATSPGALGITTITFPAQTARYLRVTQTGTNPAHHWSIYELDVFNSP